MADSLQSTLQCLHSLLNSKNPNRATQAFQYASDLYTLCVESVTDAELGKFWVKNTQMGWDVECDWQHYYNCRYIKLLKVLCL